MNAKPDIAKKTPEMAALLRAIHGRRRPFCLRSDDGGGGYKLGQRELRRLRMARKRRRGWA